MRIVIAGAGEVGFHLAKLLAKEMQDIVIIDLDDKRLEYAENNLDVITIKGDATCPKILKEAKVENADLLIAVTSTESHNFTCCIIGKKMGAKNTVSRVSNAEYLKSENFNYLQELGVNHMISPERLAAKEILRLVNRSAFTDSFEFDNGALHLVGIHIEKMSPLVGKQILETAELNPNIDFLPVAIKRGLNTIVPRGNNYFKEDDFIYFISNAAGLEIIEGLTGRPKFKTQNIMILGGGKIGVATAQDLAKHFNVKLIEQDQNKSFTISDELSNVLIINGDGRNVELLEEENIENMDVFIALTGNSATNIMSCLVAKNHKVKKTIALIENIDYINLSQMVGIDTMINKKLIAASNIFRHVRAGEVLSLASLHGVEAEVLEFKAKPKSRVLNGKIKELNFPKGAIIGGVIRNNEGLITLGDFKIEESDHVVVFALNDVINEVEKFFR